jgi:hypothetical protein
VPSIAWIKAHASTIGFLGEVTVGIELQNWNQLLQKQRSELFLADP